MQLGIITTPTEVGYKYVRGLGLGYGEFTINHNINSKEILDRVPLLTELGKKYDVKVGSVGRWGQIRVDENGHIIEEALQHDKNVIDTASELGCPVFNCGVNKAEKLNFHDNVEMAIDYFGRLIEYGKSRNVKIAVYNCDWANFVYNEKTWDFILPALPELGLKYDTSHCIYRGGNYLSEMSRYGDRIYHFHLKGALVIDGKRYDDPPIGLDGTNWGAVMDVLYTKRYNGQLSIEPHSEYWKGDLKDWGVNFSINYIKPYIIEGDYNAEGGSAYAPS